MVGFFSVFDDLLVFDDNLEVRNLLTNHALRNYLKRYSPDVAVVSPTKVQKLIHLLVLYEFCLLS